MPISLPDSPTDGQTVQLGTIVYTYDATAGVWNSASATGPTLTPSTVHTSDTAPSNPNDGDMWFDSSIGKTFIWYNDGTSSQWIQMNPNTGGAGGGANLGSVSESIIPDTDITYDLGSSSKKFKDLYLSGNTLNLGNQSISATSTGIVVSEIQIGSGTNNVKLSTNASGNLITTETDSSGNSGGASPAGGAATIVADMAGLIALTGMSAGSQAYVTANNKLYFYTGSGWYLIATVQNDAPSAITGVDGSYSLAIDGTATTITAVSTDPEGFSLTWAYTASGLGSIATVSQADNVFTVTPSTDAANAGSFTLTISATDGINGAVSTIPSFSLQFSVTNSRYTSLLLKATTTGLQTFDDASTSNHTITAGGNVTASTFSPYRHGGYSAYFDGTGDRLDITSALSISGDFTVEGWFMRTPGSVGYIWDMQTPRASLLVNSSGEFRLYASGDIAKDPVGNCALNEWVHFALVRQGSGTNNCVFYQNGSSIQTFTDTGLYNTSGAFALGGRYAEYNATFYISGYLRDFRIVETAVYTSNFTSPTAPLTAITNTKFLLGDLPYFKDQSTSNHAIAVNGDPSLKPKSLFDNSAYSEADHGASAYFDGSGDYITAADHEDFNMGSENFTAECWIYPTASPSQPIIMGQWSGSYSWALEMSNNSSRHLRFLTNAGSIVDNVSSTAVPLNQWSHVALVRNGTSFVAYLNGTSVVSSTVTGALANSTNALSIGASASGSYPFQGYISNVRLVKGTAAYTSNFTPPAAPLTAITNTKFLLNPEPAIIDLAQKFHLTGGTGPEGSTTQVAIAGTKSIMHTDFSTAYGVYIRGYSPEFRLNSTFTLEFWAYLAMWNQDTHFYETYGGTNNSFDNATGTETRIGIIGSQLTHRNNFGSNAIGNYFKQNTDYSNIVYHAANYGITFDNAQWHHWAITQDDSGNCKWYLDGTQIWSYTISLPIAITNTSNYRMRSTAWGNNSSPGPAYIQDYRLTRGLIRYTSNFTPPTAELEG